MKSSSCCFSPLLSLVGNVLCPRRVEARSCEWHAFISRFVCVVGTLTACKTSLCHDNDLVLQVLLRFNRSIFTRTPHDFKCRRFSSDSLGAAAFVPLPSVPLWDLLQSKIFTTFTAAHVHQSHDPSCPVVECFTHTCCVCSQLLCVCVCVHVYASGLFQTWD